MTAQSYYLASHSVFNFAVNLNTVNYFITVVFITYFLLRLIGGALWSTPQSMADAQTAQYWSAVQ